MKVMEMLDQEADILDYKSAKTMGERFSPPLTYQDNGGNNSLVNKVQIEQW